MFEDDDFPAVTKTLASKEEPDKYQSSEFKDLTVGEISSKVLWTRASELCGNGHTMNLFDNGIEPADVVQGGVCWLFLWLFCVWDNVSCSLLMSACTEYNVSCIY